MKKRIAQTNLIFGMAVSMDMTFSDRGGSSLLQSIG